MGAIRLLILDCMTPTFLLHCYIASQSSCVTMRVNFKLLMVRKYV